MAGMVVVDGNVMQVLLARRMMTVPVAHRLLVRCIVVIGFMARVTAVRVVGLVLFWSTIGFRTIGHKRERHRSG
jgi:hypothetical protein